MSALYAFALIGGTAPGPLLSAPDGTPVEALKLPMGQMLACRVSGDMVARFKAAETIAGLRAVTDWILFHERMSNIAAESGPNYPFGFATLFSSEEAMQAALVPHAGRLADYFAHVAGAGEWAIKICAAKRADRRLEDAAEAKGGLDYLRRRKARASVNETADARVRADALIGPLVAATRDWRVLRNGLAPAPDLEVVATHAALVDHAQTDLFRSLAAELAGQSDLVLTVTGPWPAFSFRPNLAD